MRLKDKKVLITGGTSGIGLATARLFLNEGAQVIVTGQKEKDESNLSLEYSPEQFKFFSYDTSRISEIDRLVEFVKTQFSSLDIAFINAGIAQFGAIEDISEKQFDAIMNINFKGMFFTLQKLSPLFSNPASVILTASSGIHKAHWGSTAYSASKSAVRSLAVSLSNEWISRGIRVNVISPGSTETALFTKLGLNDEQLQSMKEDLISNIPNGRLVLAEEIANAVFYLAAPGSESQTGTEIIRCFFFLLSQYTFRTQNFKAFMGLKMNIIV